MVVPSLLLQILFKAFDELPVNRFCWLLKIKRILFNRKHALINDLQRIIANWPKVSGILKHLWITWIRREFQFVYILYRAKRQLRLHVCHIERLVPPFHELLEFRLARFILKFGQMDVQVLNWNLVGQLIWVEKRIWKLEYGLSAISPKVWISTYLLVSIEIAHTAHDRNEFAWELVEILLNLGNERGN